MTAADEGQDSLFCFRVYLPTLDEEGCKRRSGIEKKKKKEEDVGCTSSQCTTLQ